MADLLIQLKNGAGDLLYPKIKTSNVINDADFASNSYVDTQISALSSRIDDLESAALVRSIVETLPTEDISTNTVYMILKSASEPGYESDANVYNEYMYINNKWELIGDTAIDISGKADKATTLAGYGISDAYTKTEIDTTLADYATLQELSDSYYNKGEVDGFLALKAPLASPAFTGLPTTTDVASDSDSSRVVNKGYVDAAVAAMNLYYEVLS